GGQGEKVGPVPFIPSPRRQTHLAPRGRRTDLGVCPPSPHRLIGERSEERAGLGAGRGVQLLLQQPLQLGELSLRRLPLPPPPPQRPAQTLMAPLPQRARTHRPPRIVQRSRHLPLRFQQADQLGQPVQIPLRQPLALQQRPLLVAAGEQLPPIPLRRLGEAA